MVVGHVFSGSGCFGTLFIGCGQILEDQLQAAQGQTIGVVRCHDGGIGFQSVGDGVDTGGGGEAPGGVHHHVRVHNGHLGQQLIVGQRIFDACGFVRNDRKGRHFGAGDFAYDLGEHKSDDDLRASMADALDDFFGNRQDCDIF